MDKSDLSAIMSTDLCTSKSLKGFYGVRPTMKMLPTQPMFNISMEEMDMTVSEHYCCSGGGYGTDPKEATYLGILPQYLGLAQDGQIMENKEDDTELDSHSEDEDTHHAVYITAGGKEGFGKEPDQMDGGHNDGAGGAPGCSIKVPTMAQMRARTAACGKRIDIRKHLAHEAIKNGHLILRKVPTTLQLADIMTKDVKQPRCMDGLLGKPLLPSVETVVAQEGEDD